MKIKLISAVLLLFLTSCGSSRPSEDELRKECEENTPLSTGLAFTGFSLKELETLQINVVDSPSDLHNRSIRLSELPFTYLPIGYAGEPVVTIPSYGIDLDKGTDYRGMEFKLVVKSVNKSYFIKDLRMGEVQMPMRMSIDMRCVLASYSMNDVLIDNSRGIDDMYHFGNILIAKDKESL